MSRRHQPDAGSTGSGQHTGVAEENLRLKNREVDELYLKPVVLGLVQIIDRHSAELSAAEKQAFATIEELRAMDKEELLQTLAALDVTPFDTGNSKVDVAFHTIKGVRATIDRRKVGRIARVLRPGYRRNSDGFVFRKVWVPEHEPELTFVLASPFAERLLTMSISPGLQCRPAPSIGVRTPDMMI